MAGKRSAKKAKTPARPRQRGAARVRPKPKTEKIARARKRGTALAEALEQQAATSEILRVISRSPTDVQPVFDAIARSAARLCAAKFCHVFQFDGKLIDVVAHHGLTPELFELLREQYPVVPDRRAAAPRSILSGAVEQIPDARSDPDFELGAFAAAAGQRSIVAVPMLREGRPIGSIAVARAAPGLFPERQIELLRTFADQAVIAIENVRLFNETKGALERQTATSEVLGAISGAQTDASPVFETIARNAHRLSGAVLCNVLRYDGSLLHIAACCGFSPQEEQQLRKKYPVAPGDASVLSGRVILSGKVEQIDDVLIDALYDQEHAAIVGLRRVLGVPVLRDGAVLGVIVLAWREPGQTPAPLMDLLRTFADQAVIAIENVRLFKELEARNRDLSEALEQQTATSEILRVISASPRDVQPVFDAIASAALKLCAAGVAMVARYDGKLVELAAIANLAPGGEAALRQVFPRPPSMETTSCRAVLTGKVEMIADVLDDPHYKVSDQATRAGFRSTLAVPLMRGGQPIGCITVGRPEPGRYGDDEIGLLQTFADQAVIAIENVRLFTELEARTKQLSRSVGELKALGEVGQAVSSTLDLDTVLSTIASRAIDLAGSEAGSIFEYDAATEQFYIRATHGLPQEVVDAMRAVPFRKGEGVLGQLALRPEPVQIGDIADERVYQSSVREMIIGHGFRSLLAVPLLREGKLLGGLSVNRKRAGGFDPQVVTLLKTFAAQSALAIQNARLFRELEDKGRQLETASRHKSEFLANMSHELRTPLNAIIGFSEVLAERMFGEVNDKQAEYLADILESGRHLLSLINDILDLSKIEAGRMELEPSEFDLPGAIENTLILVRERAQRREIALERTLDARLGTIRADERKVKQVLLNLLSNALKFTPEGGRIDVRASLHDGAAEISVTDTGVGIAPEDQAAVFEEFRQVGSTAKKAEGTGLGLAISRKFVELHGGRMWVASEPGKGSTFAFTLPMGSG